MVVDGPLLFEAQDPCSIRKTTLQEIWVLAATLLASTLLAATKAIAATIKNVAATGYVDANSVAANTFHRIRVKIRRSILTVS